MCSTEWFVRFFRPTVLIQIRCKTLKNMIKIYLTLIVLLFSVKITAQDLPKILSEKICSCIENEKIVEREEIGSCFNKVIGNNIENITKYYKVDSADDVDVNKLAAEVSINLSKNCDYLNNNLRNPKSEFQNDFIPEENIDCNRLKSGEFYYIIENVVTKKNDTTYITIRDKMFLERMENGKKYSLLDINWVTDCQFELIFKNSNDPMKNNFSKEGDKYLYDIVSSTSNSFVMRLNFLNQIYKVEFFILE